jgi:hypothetical protein
VRPVRYEPTCPVTGTFVAISDIHVKACTSATVAPVSDFHKAKPAAHLRFLRRMEGFIAALAAGFLSYQIAEASDPV